MRNPNKQILLSLLISTNTAVSFAEQPATHLGLDVLNPEVNRQLTHCLFTVVAGEADNWRPSYVLNCKYPLADISGHEILNLFVTASGNAYLYRESLQSGQMMTYPGFLELTLDDATRFWGTPQRHATRTSEYLIFDAYNSPHANQEKNLYHIDLKVDNKNHVVAYRVRGISIPEPDWITSQTQSASVDK